MDTNSIDIEKFLEKGLGIKNPKLRNQLGQMAVRCTADKGKHLLKMGEMPTDLYILWSGICRGYLEDENGQDTTDCFAVKRGSILWGCGPLNAPSLVGIETMTDCELIRFPMKLILELMEDYDIMRVFNRYLFHALELHWTMRLMLCQHSAMERYRWFLTQYPGLIDQVNKRYIASFLGMTPVTLSRLRKDLRKRSDGMTG